jgi:hypothetical protein
MDRTTGAVEYRRRLCTELHQLLDTVRPEQLTLTELNDTIDLLRPAADRVRERHRSRVLITPQ